MVSIFKPNPDISKAPQPSLLCNSRAVLPLRFSIASLSPGIISPAIAPLTLTVPSTTNCAGSFTGYLLIVQLSVNVSYIINSPLTFRVASLPTVNFAPVINLSLFTKL